jgi:tRNA(fMet)-specific endonuclease VapC
MLNTCCKQLNRIAGGLIFMNGKYLLDTNIVIPLFADDSLIKAHIRQASEVFIPVIVIGELLYGAEKTSHKEENIAKIHAFIQENVILRCDSDTARKYGKIKDQLRKDGHPIPENDIWIAAIALQHSLVLVSRDSHFRDVDGLLPEKW